MRCLICQNLAQDSEFLLWGEAICEKCEAGLMETKVEQAEYAHLIRALKSLLQRHCPAALTPCSTGHNGC